MSDTMMAFLAMMLMMFFSLSQNEAIVLSQKEAASIELEVMAHGALGEIMQKLAQQKFDQSMQDGGPLTRDNQDLSLLTPPEEFPTGKKIDNCTAIECAHLIEPDTAFFPVSTDAAGNEIGFTFMTTAFVQYVDEEGNPSDDPTWTKEVTLYVDQFVEEGETKFLARHVTKKQRFSPKW
jgi:hypothetical protein